MPTIQQLNRRHPGVNLEQLKDLRALYAGGESFEARLGRFLPMRPHEPGNFYELRVKEYTYRNYVSPIVGFFTALLFSSRPNAVASQKADKAVKSDGSAVPAGDAAVFEAPPFYSELREDCDRTGRDLDALFKSTLTDAMVAGYAWVRLHHAGTGDEQPANMAQHEALGLDRVWLSSVKHEQLLDWDTDETGNLAWALVFSSQRHRESLDSSHDLITEYWDHIQADRVDVYQITYRSDRRPTAEDNVPLVSSTPHRFGAVPLVCLELPSELWLASHLKTPQLAHFRLSNAQQWGLFTTCYAQPLYKLLDMTNPPRMGAGYGLMLGAEESVEWLSPPTAPYAALGDAIKEHKDEIFRVAHTMALGVENNAASVGRSGESKAADAEATRVVLLSFSRLVKEAIEKTYQLISAARGDKLTWSIEGLDDFAAADISGLVDTLEVVEKTGGIPSDTFNTQMKTRLAESLLPDMDEATKQIVREEIKAGIAEAKLKEAKAEKEQADMMKAALNKPKDGPGGSGDKKPFGPPGGIKPRPNMPF